MFADAHCDTLTRCFDLGEGMYENSGHLDLKRLEAAGCGLQIFAAWIDPVYEDGRAFERADKVIDYFYKNVPPDFPALLSIEGGSAIEGDIDKLKYFYNRGVRILTLTWNGSNEIGHGALSGCDDGLTDFGKTVLKEMERLNMVYDVSHLNDRGFYDVLENFNGPVAATHSNARAVCNHKRNLTDEQIKAIIERNGFIGLNFYPDFLSEGNATVTDIIRHADYIMSLGGENVLGIGADFDGVDCLPRGITGVESIEFLKNEFCKNGYNNNHIEKIFKGNLVNFTQILKN